ncbi:MAG: type II toxin-antitoxin system RelE/ParE family toxin [Candidatus Gastranaerophilales bacterium]|nr:type II toxin-antitoxin system RelE/ParE family toxin [Candidatus Gastranaerophilales bacterium]
MIMSFKHKGLEEFYKTGSVKGIQPIHQKRLRLILNRLNLMESLKDIDFPSARLHELSGNMRGIWSITVQANWRITFKYNKTTSDVYIVDYQDYH